MLCKHACGLGARDELLRRMGQVPVLGALCPALCVFNRARCVGLLRAAVTCVMQWNCGQDHHAANNAAAGCPPQARDQRRCCTCPVRIFASPGARTCRKKTCSRHAHAAHARTHTPTHTYTHTYTPKHIHLHLTLSLYRVQSISRTVQRKLSSHRS